MLARYARRDERAPEPETRTIQPFGPWGNQETTASGLHVSERSATQLLAVHGCVALIADTISTLPFHVYRDRADGSKEDVPQPRWLQNPNQNTTLIEFTNQTIVSLLLDGNAYWVYSVDGNGLPLEVHVLDPHRVHVEATSNAVGADIRYSIDGVVYRGNILHLKGIIRPGDVKGLSPVEAARQSIGLGLAAQEYASRFYSNGASLSGVIQTPQDLTLDQARDTVRKFAADHAGLRNAHRPGLLDNGATWSAISVTPEQAQFLESRLFQTTEIASQMFLLDPSWFGMVPPRSQTITYQNIEQRGVVLAQFTLARWYIRFEKAISALLPKPQYAKFNLDAIHRPDLVTQGQYFQMALGGQSGTGPKWLTEDEVRELIDRGPMPKQPAAPVIQMVPAQNPTASQPTGTDT